MSKAIEALRRVDLSDEGGLDELARMLYREGFGVGPDHSNGVILHKGRAWWSDQLEFIDVLKDSGHTHGIAYHLYAAGFGAPEGGHWDYKQIHGEECGCQYCRAIPMSMDRDVFVEGQIFSLGPIQARMLQRIGAGEALVVIVEPDYRGLFNRHTSTEAVWADWSSDEHQSVWDYLVDQYYGKTDRLIPPRHGKTDANREFWDRLINQHYAMTTSITPNLQAVVEDNKRREEKEQRARSWRKVSKARAERKRRKKHRRRNKQR